MKLDIHYLYTAKYAKWIIIGLLAFFSILIIYEWSTLLFLPSGAITNPTPGNELITRNKQAMVDNILKSTLFGEYVPNNLNNVKKSMLNVSLVGILLADKKEDSQVIIGAANGEETSYKIGDTIPGGALIKRIAADGVLVERNGVLESLSLPKNDLIFQPLNTPFDDEAADTGETPRTKPMPSPETSPFRQTDNPFTETFTPE